MNRIVKTDGRPARPWISWLAWLVLATTVLVSSCQAIAATVAGAA
jgi:hypothetical protein